MKATLIFDIGKTNKKCFLFDEDFQQLKKEYSRFPEITDEDGFPCDDLHAIQNWMQQTFDDLAHQSEFEVKAVNFSTYGASFVHVDNKGEPLTPLYNYLKPIPQEVLDGFYAKYGDQVSFARQTASPTLGMLNSGLQLYWLKYTRPEVFKQIRWSLHFPQYVSYLFTGIPLSEYTSIGCHTGLWDFEKQDYHQWVYQEGIDRILPPVVPTSTSINKRFLKHNIKVGVGIHDSSAALLPYIRAERKPFILVSTGTWSISLNPFNDEILSAEDLANDCLNFMRVDGGAVKAARLFLGNEYKLQTKKLQQHFGVADDAHKTTQFCHKLYDQLRQDKKAYFAFESLNIQRQQPEKSDYSAFANFQEAYHRLMLELVELQIAAIDRARGGSAVKKLFIDGGFADNDLFVKMIGLHYKDLKLRTTQSPLGSALGAAIVISEAKVAKKFLKKNYALKKPILQLPK
jgi:L-fuculokinase